MTATPSKNTATAPVRRQVWASGGFAHLEVGARGHATVTAEQGRSLEHALEAVAGVRWAAWNGMLGRLVVSYDEAALGRRDLVGALARAESGTIGLDHATGPPEIGSTTGDVTALAIDVLAAVAAFTARQLRLPATPRELAAIVALFDHVPPLRRALSRAVGAGWADLGLSAASAAIGAAAQSRTAQIADAVLRVILLLESSAERDAWTRRAADLHHGPGSSRADSPDAGARPVPPPDGPVERYARQISTVSLLAAGVLTMLPAGTRRAARVLIAGTPGVAAVGREAYAARLGRLLAQRGVLVRTPAVLRLLDRVDTVVVDARALLTGRTMISQVVAVRGATDTAREQAARLIGQPRDGIPTTAITADGWTLGDPARLAAAVPEPAAEALRAHDGGRGKVLALIEGSTLVALVRVEAELDPLATALLNAGRQAGRVLLAGAGAELRHRLQADGTVAGGSRLAGSIRALQRDDHVVMLVADRNDAALSAADCGFGLLRERQRPPWGAHLMGGPGLETAWLVLEATSLARKISNRSVRVALLGSAAGGLLGVADPEPQGAQRTVLSTKLARLANLAGAVWSVRGIGRRPPPAPDAGVAWHTLPVEEVLRILDTSKTGMSEQAAGQRLRSAPAVTDGDGERGLLATTLAELDTPLTMPLAAGAGISAVTGSNADAVLVLAVILANALLSGVQDLTARRTLRALVSAAGPRVRLRRAEGDRIGTLEELVPGDIVLLEPGDAVPADCRLIETSGLEMDESTVTGESMPVTKDAGTTQAAAVAERANIVYAGTSVAAGSATAVVVATGQDTETGRTARTALREAPAGGVQERLSRLTKASLPVAGGAALALLTTGLLRGRLSESISSSVALAVAAIPEGLPFIATAAELSASRRLSRRNILVRDPHSMEALGRVDVVCFDKTGTLTEGRIALRTVSDGRMHLPVEELTAHHRRVLAAALRASPPQNGTEALPHPTDQAVVAGGEAAGVHTDEGIRGWHVAHELPFEPARGFHAVLGRARGSQVISVKGAPETTLPRCTTWRPDGETRPLTPADRQEIEAEVDRLAGQGLRVLAVAERAASARKGLDSERVEGMELLGLLGLADQTRPSAAEAIHRLRQAGIKVIMLTGDHPSTAATIAAELDLLDGGTVITGPELDDADPDTVDALVSKASVFARVSPANKVAVVRSLRRTGHVVAVTGDGANDAPAIRLADVGIALGDQATTAARQAADMIVMDGRIETIADGVVEGRAMWVSVREALALLLGGNLGETLFTVGSSMVSSQSPLNTRQILFVNLMTDLLPAITVAARPPRHVTPEQVNHEGPESSLGETLTRDVVRRAVATTTATAAAWLAAKATGTNGRASTVALASLVGTQLAQTALVSGRDPLVLAATGASAAALVGVVQTPGLSQLFGSRPLGPVAWGIVLAATGLGMALAALPLPTLRTTDSE
jgi:cation-transporting ATPase I